MYELLALLRLYEIERWQWQQERRALLARCLRAEKNRRRKALRKAVEAQQ